MTGQCRVATRTLKSWNSLTFPSRPASCSLSRGVLCVGMALRDGRRAGAESTGGHGRREALGRDCFPDHGAHPAARVLPHERAAEAPEYHEGLEPLRPADGKGGSNGARSTTSRCGSGSSRRSRRGSRTMQGCPSRTNQAERNVRMMKLRMKILGGFCSAQRTQDFATLRGVLATARKQGRNRIGTLLQGSPVPLDGRCC